MLIHSFRRSRIRRSWLGPLCLAFLTTFLADLLLTLLPSRHTTRISPDSFAASAQHGERIFIASMHWNTEYAIRAHWAPALLDLIRYLGPDNVFVSIIEGGSYDNSAGALRELDVILRDMGVGRRIVFEEKTHKEEAERTPVEGEQGWVWTKRGRRELRRIPWLADIRNRVMEPLRELAAAENAQTFDKVLWLNDVIFTTEDVTTLLATRNGDYAAACSLDFSKPPIYYDTFALRDISGAQAITEAWPFFLSHASRDALIANQPVPVQSCWNGIIAFDAVPFYVSSPPRFRGIDDSLAAHHLEGSECCLIHADNPASRERGVWLNPNVRVSFNAAADEVVNPRDGGAWPGVAAKVWGLWANRWVRLSRGLVREVKRRVVLRRIAQWEGEGREVGRENREAGLHCLVNEMQVLVERGWAHV